MSNQTASDIAFRAADHMSKAGHCKGKQVDEEGHVCFWGALRSVAGYYSGLTETVAVIIDLTTIRETASDILRETGRVAEPVTYNDRPGTTGEDVILLLKETGARLRDTPDA